MGTIWLLVVIVAVVAVGVGVIYNALVGLRNRATAAWSDIEVQLKRRHDLVGNLVETVKGYAAYEQRTLEDLVAARTRASDATDNGGPREAGAAENVLTARVHSVFAVAEAYPDLKASERYADLHDALVALENDIQNARRYYNAVVRDFNTKIQTVPSVLVARPFGFRERDFFQLSDPGESAVPEVRLQ